jgi:hypothetical protein
MAMPFIETPDHTRLFVTDWGSGAPVVFTHAGDKDASAPIDLTGLRTAALIAGATLIVYPGAGHGLYASDHELLNADLLAFIHDGNRQQSNRFDSSSAVTR